VGRSAAEGGVGPFSSAVELLHRDLPVPGPVPPRRRPVLGVDLLRPVPVAPVAPPVAPPTAPSPVTAAVPVPTADPAHVVDTSGAAPGASTDRAAGTPRFRLGNRPALTGIRAPLIVSILIYHANYTMLRGAWASMSVFFVLSGFLITSMLAGQHQETGRIDLRQFFTRRATRLLPPLFLTVTLLALYAIPVRVASAASDLWGDVSAAVFYYADYRSALGHEPAVGYLAQAWSLSVEEQFYLVWAVVFVVALRYGGRRWAYAAATVGLVVSLADRTALILGASRWDTAVYQRVYYAFDSRCDALFLGCLLGLVASGGHLGAWSARVGRALVVAAAASGVLMVWVAFAVPVAGREASLLWLPLTELASALIIVHLVVHPGGRAAAVLGLPLLVLVGEMSYAAYLVHWPVYVAISPFTVTWPFWLEETVRLVIIVTIAAVSWHVIERPLMEWRRRLAARPAPAGRPVEDGLVSR
jgi:peptidoglycan/LPS O-acetylase OafA/YrhL